MSDCTQTSGLPESCLRETTDASISLYHLLSDVNYQLRPRPGCYSIRYYPHNQPDGTAYYEGTIRITLELEDAPLSTDWKPKLWEISNVGRLVPVLLKLLRLPFESQPWKCQECKKPGNKQPCEKCKEAKSHLKTSYKRARRAGIACKKASRADKATTASLVTLVHNLIEQIVKVMGLWVTKQIDHEVITNRMEALVDPIVLRHLPEDCSDTVNENGSRKRRIILESILHDILRPHPSHKLRTSGDLYIRHHDSSDAIETLSLSRDQQGRLRIEMIDRVIPFMMPDQKIPIFSRKDYRYYLRPTVVAPGAPSSENFSLKFQVTHFDQESKKFDGSGRRTFEFFRPTKTEQKALYEKFCQKADPNQTESFIENLYLGGVRSADERMVGVVCMGRVSNAYIRQGRLVIDFAEDPDKTIPLPNQKIHETWCHNKFESVNWDLTVDKFRDALQLIENAQKKNQKQDDADDILNDISPCAMDGFRNLRHYDEANHLLKTAPKPAPVPARERIHWTVAELHEAMASILNRDQEKKLPLRWQSPDSDLDKAWTYHLLAVPSIAHYGRGVMYDVGAIDKNQVPREGAAIAWNYRFPGKPFELRFREGNQTLSTSPNTIDILISEKPLQIFAITVVGADGKSSLTTGAKQLLREMIPRLISIVSAVRSNCDVDTVKGRARKKALRQGLIDLILRFAAIESSGRSRYERRLFSRHSKVTRKYARSVDLEIQPETLLLRTAIHELGHLMGLGHNFSSDGFMSTTDVVALNRPMMRAIREKQKLEDLKAIQQRIPNHNPDTSEARIDTHHRNQISEKLESADAKYNDALIGIKEFPNNAEMQFDPKDSDTLQHGPDYLVRPGAHLRGFRDYNDRQAHITMARGLQLKVDPLHSHLPFGAAVRLEITLTNTTNKQGPPRTLSIPSQLDLSSGHVSGWVISPHGGLTPIHPPVISDDIAGDNEPLEAGETKRYSLILLRTSDHVLFGSSGRFQIKLAFEWNSFGAEYIESGTSKRFRMTAETSVRVGEPSSTAEESIIRTVLNASDAITYGLEGGMTSRAAGNLADLSLVPDVARHYDAFLALHFYRLFTHPPTETLRGATPRRNHLELAISSIHSATVFSHSEETIAAKMITDALYALEKTALARALPHQHPIMQKVIPGYLPGIDPTGAVEDLGD